MGVLLEVVGILAALIAVCAVLVSLVSGIGVVIALGAVAISGLSAVAGNARYAWFTMIVVTLDLLFFSVPLQTQDAPVIRAVLHIVLPYVVAFALIGIGIYRRKRKTAG